MDEEILIDLQEDSNIITIDSEEDNNCIDISIDNDEEILIDSQEDPNTINVDSEEDDNIEISVNNNEAIFRTDYNLLHNKPQINSIELKGNKTLEDLNIQEKGNYPNERVTNIEIDNLFN